MKHNTFFVLAALFTTVVTHQATAQWALVTTPPPGIQRVDASHFFSGTTGVIAGCSQFSSVFGGTRILRTTNGGTNWTAVYTADSGGALAMDFADANLGMASIESEQNPPSLIRTTNGGQSWTVVDQGTQVPWSAHALDFVNTQVGYAAGYGNQLARTMDGGLTWTVLPDPFPTAHQTLNTICFVTTMNGFTAGGDMFGGGTGKLLHTTDGATTWDTVAYGVRSYFEGIEFFNTTTGLAFGMTVNGNDGRILRTTDGGNTWSPATINGSDVGDVMDVEITGANTAFAVTNNTQIFYTSNGGVTWNPQTVPSVGVLIANNISVANGVGYCFAVGSPFYFKNGSATAIEEISNGQGISVWPTPFNGSTLNLRFDDAALQATNMTVEVMDVQGRRVSYQQLAATGTDAVRTLVFTQPLRAGLYTCLFSSAERTFATRLMVQ